MRVGLIWPVEISNASSVRLPRPSPEKIAAREGLPGTSSLFGTVPALVSSAQRLSKKQTELRNESSNAKRFYSYRTDDRGCDHRYLGCDCAAGLSRLHSASRSFGRNEYRQWGSYHCYRKPVDGC